MLTPEPTKHVLVLLTVPEAVDGAVVKDRLRAFGWEAREVFDPPIEWLRACGLPGAAAC